LRSGVLWVVGHLYIIGVCCVKYVLIVRGESGRMVRFLYDVINDGCVEYNVSNGQDEKSR